MYYILFIVGILLMLMILFSSYKVELVKGTVFSVIFYFFEYVLCSAMLFWINQFTVKRVLFLVVVINIILFLPLLIKKKKAAYTTKVNQWAVPLLVVIIMLPAVVGKFGFFGMGQDQGVYQTKAIELLHNDTFIQKSFYEYENLSDDEKIEFMKSLQKLAGADLYINNLKPSVNPDEQINDTSYIYHGIPTFPALLALSVVLFGFSNMAGIQTIFWICAIFIVYYCAENLKLKRLTRLAAVFLTSICPVIIWVSKASLTEMFLTLLVSTWLYFMTLPRSNRAIWGSLLCIGVFAFYHVSLYTVIPGIVLIYFILFLKTKDKAYIGAASVSVLEFGIGYWMMTVVSPGYSFNNVTLAVKRLIPFFTDEMVYPLFCGAIIIVLILALLLKKWSTSVGIFFERIPIWLWDNLIRVFLSGSVIVAIWLIYKYSLSTEDLATALNKVTLGSYAISTGIIVLPFILVRLIKSPAIFYKTDSYLMLFTMFLYCILFHGIVLRSEIPYFFYYSRYMAPYIPIIFLCGGIFLDQMARRNREIISLCIMVISFCIYLPFNHNLRLNKDDTRIDFETLEEISNIFHAGDAVVISDQNDNYELQQLLWLPVKEISGAAVYPSFDDLDSQIADLKMQYQNVYLISINKYNGDNAEIVYRNFIHRSEDDAHFVGEWIKYPWKFWQHSYPIEVYSIS